MNQIRTVNSQFIQFILMMGRFYIPKIIHSSMSIFICLWTFFNFCENWAVHNFPQKFSDIFHVLHVN